MLAYALEQVTGMSPGDMFAFQTLFEDYSDKWRDIPIADRVSAGLRFYHSFFDKQGHSRNGILKLCGKTEDSQQIYQKEL